MGRLSNPNVFKISDRRIVFTLTMRCGNIIAYDDRTLFLIDINGECSVIVSHGNDRTVRCERGPGNTVFVIMGPHILLLE